MRPYIILSIVVVTAFTFIGCNCKFNLNTQAIKSTCYFTDGVLIAKLTVKSFTEQGVPLEFTRDTVLRYSPICTELSKEDRRVLEKTGVNIPDTTCDFKATKTLYFKKNNPNYEWTFIEPMQVQQKFEVMPINFKKEVWYEISNLKEFKNSNPQIYLYFMIQENGELITRQLEK
jgi:hypothetical protein